MRGEGCWLTFPSEKESGENMDITPNARVHYNGESLECRIKHLRDNIFQCTVRTITDLPSTIYTLHGSNFGSSLKTESYTITAPSTFIELIDPNADILVSSSMFAWYESGEQ